MSASREDFVAIAKAIRDAHVKIPADTGEVSVDWVLIERTRVDTARRIADVLARTNPRFNRDKFLDACGV